MVLQCVNTDTIICYNFFLNFKHLVEISKCFEMKYSRTSFRRLPINFGTKNLFMCCSLFHVFVFEGWFHSMRIQVLTVLSVSGFRLIVSDIDFTNFTCIFHWEIVWKICIWTKCGKCISFFSVFFSTEEEFFCGDVFLQISKWVILMFDLNQTESYVKYCFSPWRNQS